MRTIFKKMACAGIALFVFAGVGFAQPTPAQIQQQQFQQQQQMMNAIRSDNMRNCGDEHGHGCRRRNTGPSAAEVRAWHARERKIQAEIAQHKATPYWMVIGRDWERQGFIWSGGYESKQRAVEETLKQCKSSKCGVVAAFSNACGVIVYAVHHPQTTNDIFIGVDADDKKAAAEAMQACQAVHGNRQDRCFYSGIKTKHGTAFCTGYDYSIYGQK